MKPKIKIIVPTPKGYKWHGATRISKNKVEMEYILIKKDNENYKEFIKTYKTI